MDNAYSDLMQSLITATKTIFPDNKVIRAVLSGVEPANPYVAIKVIRETQIGTATLSTLLDSNHLMTTKVNYEALVQFSFTSADEEVAGNLARTFIQQMNSPVTREQFRKNNLSKSSISSVRNVPYKREMEWTQYFNVDVTFNYATVTKQEMVPITAVQVTEEISGTVFLVPPDVIIP